MSNRKYGSLTDYIIKRRKQKDNELKYDFMPSLLEIIEKPSHIACKVIIITISVLLLFSIFYASVTEIDIVVTGQGNVVATNKSLDISSAYSGKISELNVNVGDYVKSGDVLLVLDTNQLVVDRDLLLYEYNKTLIEKEILTLFAKDDSTEIDISQYDEKYVEFIESLVLDNKLYKEELKVSYNEELTVLQRESELKERIASIEELLVQYENKLVHYENQINAMTIISNIDGYVSEINVNGIGENIMANTVLLTIIPDVNDMIFEGYISDKDISSIALEDTVQIKLSSYPFSDYGAIYGKITEISKSGRYIEGVGNVYVVKVAFDKELNSNIRLEYSMSGNLEIKVGKRTLMDYFLEPLKKGLDNSLKEK